MAGYDLLSFSYIEVKDFFFPLISKYFCDKKGVTYVFPGETYKFNDLYLFHWRYSKVIIQKNKKRFEFTKKNDRLISIRKASTQVIHNLWVNSK